jgi:hypothetical protein
VLHDDEGDAVGRVDDVEDARDMLALEAVQRPSLALEPRDEVGFVADGGVGELQGDRAAELAVMSGQDHPHAPLAELLDDLVFAEDDFAGFEGCQERPPAMVGEWRHRGSCQGESLARAGLECSSRTHLLRHLGEQTEPPAREPARGPSCRKSRVLRRAARGPIRNPVGSARKWCCEGRPAQR